MALQRTPAETVEDLLKGTQVDINKLNIVDARLIVNEATRQVQLANNRIVALTNLKRAIKATLLNGTVID